MRRKNANRTLKMVGFIQKNENYKFGDDIDD